ncbi:TIGR01620 family protein [Celerinatantimonas diazotrophica]|uniref:Putative membrane protein n=1 Tax=Celerinatantimonas diazotrophica TaxID=412034 RepID=A0A4R1KI57_9GAMM|nr:TIGR01620 family protein [Celerinatantimonas diazotrophica]TCK63920.1 putative membrane protein [Celerinatantimonas diazotrophica]CAG9297005.1 hypothetical protein CEDIAZO_02167 [Celerinatantimonas diazotrophica]
MNKLAQRENFSSQLENDSPVEDSLSERIDFTSDPNWQRVDEDEYNHDLSFDVDKPSQSLKLQWYWKALALGLAVIIIWPLFRAVDQLIFQPWGANSLYSVAVVVVSLIIFIAILRELWAVYRFKKRSNLDLSAQFSASGAPKEKLIRQLNQMALNMGENSDHWQAGLEPYHETREILGFFENKVLSVQDKKAKKLVLRYSSQSAVMLALSPSASLDMALMMWRNLCMMRQMARLYGLPSGMMMQTLLVKTVLANIAFAGVSQVISDMGVEMMGTGLTRKLSASAADGLSAGLLTARLGYQCLQVCRPFKLSAEQMPKLASVQRQLLKDIMQMSSKG